MSLGGKGKTTRHHRALRCVAHFPSASLELLAQFITFSPVSGKPGLLSLLDQLRDFEWQLFLFGGESQHLIDSLPPLQQSLCARRRHPGVELAIAFADLLEQVAERSRDVKIVVQ